MISVHNVSKAFGDQVVLNNVSLEVREGEILVILGASGTGKSVLLKHMIGLLHPDEGHIELDGQDISQLTEEALLTVRKKIGFLFQEGALYDFMNVFDNIAFPLREHTDFDKETIKQKVNDILGQLDLKDINKKFPSELSGGMKKRVALARAVILDSKILFCDEPTSGLDPIRSRDISALIRDTAKKLHCTTVVTSHDIQNSFRIADRIALVRDGAIVACGTPQELKDSKDSFVLEFIQ
ncbi:Phospholipid ABC transporter ATP-binding protein MlaF [hydrothermal vent metagenome]|uniref:Phospholipid ABC transporter ATP-binding protein MlaF n=1 Tax=hydrothermal vent metagenome TaxID=652676 RepID=A0A3B0TGD5_9ZZZZ